MSDEAMIQIKITVPASLYLDLWEHARATKTTVSQLCRAGAMRELASAQAATAEPVADT